MSVHYKFKNSSEFSTVTFDGVHISVGDLKRAIIQQKKVGKSPDCDLQITDSESKKVYDTEDQLIPKNSSVVVARVPFGERLRKGWNRNEENPSTQTISHGRAYIDKITKSDLTNEYATEEERIKAMVSQSTSEYDTSKYVRTRGMGPLPAGYTCYRCGQTGHYIKHCPTNNTDIKRSTGIPRSFMVTASADTKGALLTANGEYAVPLIDAEAYKQTKKEKPPFAYNDSADNSNDAAIRISKEFQCPICQDLLTDAVLTPCCNTNHCDECIRNHLMESEAHECPSCHELNVSPENLIANQKLRSDVAKIIKDTGYTHGRAVVFYSGDEQNEDAITPSNKENSAEPSSNELSTASQPEPTAASTEDNSESSSQAFQHNDTIMDAAILGDQQQQEEEAEESKSTVASTTDVEDDESMPTSSSQNNNNQLPINQIQNLVQPAGFFNQGPYMNRPPMMNPQYRYPPHIRPPMYDMYGQPTGYFPPPNNFMGPYGAGPGYYYWQYNNRCNGPRNFGPPNNPMNSNYNSFPNFFDPSINYEEAVERFERHLASRSRRSRSRSRSTSPVNRDRNRRYRDERRSRSPRHERDRRRSPDRRRDQKRRSHDRSRSSKGKTKSSKTKDKDKEKSKDKSKDKAKERTKDKAKEKSRDKAKDKDITEDIAKKETSKDSFSRDNSSKDSSSKAKDKTKDKSREKTKDKAKEKSSKSKA